MKQVRVLHFTKNSDVLEFRSIQSARSFVELDMKIEAAQERIYHPAFNYAAFDDVIDVNEVKKCQTLFEEAQDRFRRAQKNKEWKGDYYVYVV